MVSPYGGISRAKVAATLISIAMIGLICVGVWLFLSNTLGDVAADMQSTAQHTAETVESTAGDASETVDNAASTTADTAESAADEGRSFIETAWMYIVSLVTNLAGEAPAVLVGSGVLGALLLVGVFFVIFDDSSSF